MGKFAVDPSCQQRMRQFQVVGRAAPTQKKPMPKVYRMRLFAKNRVLALSRFWYFMKLINKAKRSGGEVLAVNELFDRAPTKVNNYGIWLRYESRTDTHNMYKEFRDVNINGAVSQLYSEMAGRHRAKPGAIQIINTAVLSASQCKRDHVTEMHDNGLKFPLVTKLPLVNRKYKGTFKSKRPMTFVR